MWQVLIVVVWALVLLAPAAVVASASAATCAAELTCLNMTQFRSQEQWEQPLATTIRLGQFAGAADLDRWYFELALNTSSPLIPRGSAAQLEAEANLIYQMTLMAEIAHPHHLAAVAGACQTGSRGTFRLWLAAPTGSPPLLLRRVASDPRTSTELLLSRLINLVRALLYLENTSMGTILLLDLDNPLRFITDATGHVYLLFPGPLVALPSGQRHGAGRRCQRPTDCAIPGYDSPETQCHRGECRGLSGNSNLVHAFPHLLEPMIAQLTARVDNLEVQRLLQQIQRAAPTGLLGAKRLLAMLELVKKAALTA